MATVEKEAKSFSSIEDEEDALLKEAISCSSNLDIKTDDDDEEQVKENIANGQQKGRNSSVLWCDVESSNSSRSDLSMSKIESDKSLNSSKEDGWRSTAVEEKDMDNSSPARKRLRDEDVDEDTAKVTRNRRNSNSSSSTLSSNKNTEYETDPVVLARRQKDIDYGKNTVGYDRYSQTIPKDQRTKEHPRTPPMYSKYSRRGWDGLVKLWRKQLHFWDPKEHSEDNKEDKIEIREENASS